MPPLANLLLLAFLFITVGFIGGALVSMLWIEREKRAENSTPPKDAAEDENPGHLELQTRLWRDPASGKLVAGYSEQLYADAQKVPPRHRKQMLDLAREWISWLGGVNETPTDPSTLVVADEPVQSRLEAAARLPEAAQSDPAPLSRANDTYSPKNTGSLSRAGLPPEKTQGPQRSLKTGPLRPVENPPRPAGTGALRQTGGTPPARTPEAQQPAENNKKPAQPASIVAQIDQILQDMLDQPESDFKKSIRLVEHPHHGVTVWIGIDRFEGIDAVCDDEARTLIRKAVAKWEQRTERDRR